MIITAPVARTQNRAEIHGMVHCPICTHNVEATVLAERRHVRVKPGQQCSRCHSSLDAGYVIQTNRAA